MGGTGSEETRHIEIVRRLFEAFATQDAEMLRNVFTADAQFRRIAIGPLQSDFRGPQAIADFFAAMHSQSNGTLRLEPLTITAGDARVLVLYRITGARNGKTLDTNHVLVVTFAEDVITEVVMFARDFTALADFWA